MNKPNTLADLLPRLLVVENGCWEYQGALNDKGYGNFPFEGRVLKAHRASWELHYGVIPIGLNVCHKCDNPSCCNPGHLFLGTLEDNTQDMLNKGRRIHGVGSTNSFAVLNEEKVMEIKRLSSLGVSRPELAYKFGVSIATIKNIRQGRTWSHVR